MDKLPVCCDTLPILSQHLLEYHNLGDLVIQLVAQLRIRRFLEPPLSGPESAAGGFCLLYSIVRAMDLLHVHHLIAQAKKLPCKPLPLHHSINQLLALLRAIS